MKKLFVIATLFLISNALSAQEKPEMRIIKGKILACDSIPIENAYLISYKTLRAFATDKEGHFELLLDTDDSLKIHHVAYVPVIIKPQPSGEIQIIVMQYQENIIEDVFIRDGEKELTNMESNMGSIMKELKNEFLSAHTKGPTLNPYAPKDPSAGMVGLNFFELIDWIKHKRKK